MSIRGVFSAIRRLFAFARATLANLFVLAFGFALLAGVVALLSGPDYPEVPEGGALLVAPDGVVLENYQGVSPLGLLTGGSGAQTRLRDLLRAVDEAAEDDRIAALVLDPSGLDFLTPAQLEVIGEALTAFRATGKKIVAKSHYYGRDQYYLASFADEVYMHPLGEVSLSGYGLYNLYYGDLFDEFNVNVHVFRVGTHKAAVEPYTRNNMSTEAKLANQALIDSLWTHFVDQVAANRKLEPEALLAYADRYDEVLAAAGGNTAEAALTHGLVDELLVDEEVTKRLRKLTQGDDTYRRISFEDYLRPQLPPMFGDVVAVIPASGTILMGKQPAGFIGAATLTGLLRQARDDDAVKALVLRVDSGGGSAFASELIREEVERVQKKGKPVVVSMAGTAASGGYWIAATADEIWAAPTTITGSIGIFAIFPTFEGPLGDYGVYRDGVGTGPFVGALDTTAGISEAMGRVLQSSVEHGYETFIDLVARGRDLAPADVEAIAQGRVWTGEKAQQLGLVDELGDLQDAIASAADLAGIEGYKVRYIESSLSTAERILRMAVDNVAAGSTGARWRTGLVSDLAGDLYRLNDPKHIYALCDACRAF